MAVTMAVLMTSLLLFTQPTSQSPSSPVAKPGCEDRCGEVEIPYPFGIGTNCSLGEWFSIACNHSTTPPKPFMSKIQSEVTSISYRRSTITINWLIVSSSNCSNGASETKSADLTGSSFVFSRTDNKFKVVGEFLNCYGINGCQTDIPARLQVFNINLSRFQVEKEEQGCTYGFVVDRDWFRYNITSLSDLKNREFLPVVLEWSISKPMADLSGITEGETSSRYCGSGVLNPTSFGDRSSVVGCTCKNGYQGNPYLSGGCQEIDECMVSKQSPCLSHGFKNTTGGSNYWTNGTVGSAAFGDGSTVGRAILLVVSWWLYKMFKRREKAKRKENFFERNHGLLLKQQRAKGEASVEKTKLFDLRELEKATDQFNANRILSQGRQESMYKGMLTNGETVAIKKSKKVGESKIEEFINEVVILSRINHRNIVKLMGCCLETEVPLLVYEFVSNGTLFDNLHEPSEEVPLTWEMRMRIASEIAGALFYLHSAASQPIFRKDMKSSNILLDEKYRAKIVAFGTSTSGAIDQNHLTAQVQDTFEYKICSFTEKSDVYGFGVVLVELLTGQTPNSREDRLVEGQDLAFYFIDSMEKDIVFDILDRRVIKGGGQEDVIAVANLARRCLNWNELARPTMEEVLMELRSVQPSRKNGRSYSLE